MGSLEAHAKLAFEMWDIYKIFIRHLNLQKVLRSGTRWAKREVKLVQGFGQPQGNFWSICDHSHLLFFWLKYPGFYTPEMVSHWMWVSSWRTCMWRSSLQWILTLKGLRAKVVCWVYAQQYTFLYIHTHTHTHTEALLSSDYWVGLVTISQKQWTYLNTIPHKESRVSWNTICESLTLEEIWKIWEAWYLNNINFRSRRDNKRNISYNEYFIFWSE